MHNDSLFRISLKCLIKNDLGEVLVVKEAGRDFWDLPGGGLEHGDGIKASIARELKEEVGYQGEFTYSIVALDEPAKLLSRDVWQMRIIINVIPSTFEFDVGVDADEIKFVNPDIFTDSDKEQEQKIYRYSSAI